MGDEERERPDVLGRELEEERPFAQRLADQAKLTGLEIADASVDQLGRAAARSRSEIAPLEEEHAKSAKRRVPRDRGALDAAPHDEEVVCHRRPSPLPPRAPGGRSGAR